MMLLLLLLYAVPEEPGRLFTILWTCNNGKGRAKATPDDVDIVDVYVNLFGMYASPKFVLRLLVLLLLLQLLLQLLLPLC